MFPKMIRHLSGTRIAPRSRKNYIYTKKQIILDNLDNFGNKKIIWIISEIKKIFRKVVYRIELFKKINYAFTIFANYNSWRTWIEAACYYKNHLSVK